MLKQNETHGDASAEKKTILLVEDETEVRRFMRDCFQQEGYRLLCAKNGREALDLSDRFDGQIDLLVTDVSMPQMDGPTLARSMGERRPDTKVLFVSGYANKAISYFRENPCAPLIHKPFRLVDLLHKVEQLASRPAVRELPNNPKRNSG